MTYSGKIKEEISKIESEKVESISELSGILCTNADIKLYSIKVQTENLNAANRIFKIVKDNYNVTSNITVKKNYNFKKNEVYIIEIKKSVPEIIKDIGLMNETGFKIELTPREEIVADDNLKSAYLRGCFLISGSVNDPKTSRYHLEIITATEEQANFINELINSYNLNSKVLRRKKGYMVYIKESEKISDFLKLIKAFNGVMYYEDMPCGVPIPFTGEYEQDEMYPLYIQKIKIDFEIKKDHIPTVQVKKSYFYNDTEYLERSSGDVVLWVTNIDLDVIKEQYDILYIEYLGGWKFKKVNGIFRDYIDKFMAIKKTTKGAKRLLAKLLLNNLYGKFATNPNVTGKIPYLDEDDIVRYKLDEPEIKEPVYTALGVFITSYARAKTQRTAQALYHRFCYADTDSIHIVGEEIPTNIDVDDVELGKWALESTFERARFIRAKTYVEEYSDGTLNVKCAGMPQALKELVTYDNFLTGLKLEGKLLPKKYKGGVILESSEFTIK